MWSGNRNIPRIQDPPEGCDSGNVRVMTIGLCSCLHFSVFVQDLASGRSRSGPQHRRCVALAVEEG